MFIKHCRCEPPVRPSSEPGASLRQTTLGEILQRKASKGGGEAGASTLQGVTVPESVERLAEPSSCSVQSSTSPSVGVCRTVESGGLGFGPAA
eukprot:423804-Alexandrium_andersonii.AAC.1